MGNKLNMVGHICDPNLGSESRKMKNNSKVKTSLSFTTVCHSTKVKKKKKKKRLVDVGVIILIGELWELISFK